MVGRGTGVRSATGGDGVEDLNGKVAVVTGGAAGSGRGIVEALLDEGALRRRADAIAEGRLPPAALS